MYLFIHNYIVICGRIYKYRYIYIFKKLNVIKDVL